MSEKNRRSYSREFKMEAVRLITEKGCSIAEALRNLGVEYGNPASMEAAVVQRPEQCLAQREKAQGAGWLLGHCESDIRCFRENR